MPCDIRNLTCKCFLLCAACWYSYPRNSFPEKISLTAPKSFKRIHLLQIYSFSCLCDDIPIGILLVKLLLQSQSRKVYISCVVGDDPPSCADTVY